MDLQRSSLSYPGSIAALGIVIHLASCSPSPVEPTTQLQIQGDVLDAQTEAPVADAQVHLRMLDWKSSDVLVTTTTNAEGHYGLGFLEEGRCSEFLLNIEAEAEGYVTQTYGSQDSSHVLCTEELQRIDFALEPEEG